MHISIFAFLASEARSTAFREAAALPRLRRAHLRLEPGGIASARAVLGREESPDLLVLDAGSMAPDALVAELDALADVVRPGTKVIVLGDSNDIALYRRLLGMGVSDYLYGPLAAAEVQDAVLRVCAGSEDAPTGRLIAVYGAAGGVGASTVAVNLADTLAARDDETVALVDLDLWFGVDALALNLQPRQTARDALADPLRIDEVLLDRVLEKAGGGLSVLGSPATPDSARAPDDEALERLLGVLRRKADVVVLDLPHLWQPWVKTLMVEAAEVVLVAYPDLVNLRNARAVSDLLAAGRPAAAPVRLVFNKAGLSRKTELTGADFAEALGLHPVVALPFDPGTCGTAMNNGQTLRKTAPTGALTRGVEALAQAVVPRPHMTLRRGGGLRLKDLFTRRR